LQPKKPVETRRAFFVTNRAAGLGIRRQVRNRAVGWRPRIEALPSVAQSPDERWATDLCRI